MSEVKVGSVVKLKSGGPRMTVNHLESGSMECIWHDSDQGGFIRAQVNVACVDLIEDAEKAA